MYTVHKQEVKLGLHKYQVPNLHQLLTVQLQRASFVLWYVCDDEAPMEEIEILGVGTGHEIAARDNHYLDYLSTVQDGVLVWHFFAVEKKAGIELRNQ